MKTVLIMGYGVVGKALEHLILARNKTGVQVVKYDPHLGHERMPEEVDAVFICVSADTKSFKVDLSNIKDCIQRIKFKKCLIYLRSTVPPGTCAALEKEFKVKIAFMPEFLTERTAMKDVLIQNIICGGEMEHFNFLQRLFSGKNQELWKFPNESAEMGKYVHNILGAKCVNFFNFIFNICQELGINFDQVIAVASMSGNMSTKYSQVPGPDGKYGFDGKCFPKDLAAFMGFVRKENKLRRMLDDGLGYHFLKTIMCSNQRYRGLKDD